MAKVVGLDDAFSGFFERKASPLEGQSTQQNDKERNKGKAKNVTQISALGVLGIPTNAQASYMRSC